MDEIGWLTGPSRYHQLIEFLPDHNDYCGYCSRSDISQLWADWEIASWLGHIKPPAIETRLKWLEGV